MTKEPYGSAPIERRQQPRISVSTRVILRGAGPDLQVGVCTDVSEGGIGLDTDAVLAVGEVVQVEFMKGGKLTTARARIVYRLEQHYGLVFLDSLPRQ
ncbi:MAG: PilZ domain-containing protein [Terriglobales bacterium]